MSERASRLRQRAKALRTQADELESAAETTPAFQHQSRADVRRIYGRYARRWRADAMALESRANAV